MRELYIASFVNRPLTIFTQCALPDYLTRIENMIINLVVFLAASEFDREFADKLKASKTILADIDRIVAEIDDLDRRYELHMKSVAEQKQIERERQKALDAIKK